MINLTIKHLCDVFKRFELLQLIVQDLFYIYPHKLSYISEKLVDLLDKFHKRMLRKFH